jgi:outer membrane protein OmpU
MKKILFASTALVAAGLMTGTASASDKIKLNVGGFSKWWVIGAWQDDDFLKVSANATGFSTAKRVNADVKGDNEIWFSGDTTLDNGLKVGAFFSMEAGGHSDMTTDVIDASYAWVQGGFGKVLLGTSANGTALLHVQAPDAAANFGNGGMMVGNFSVLRPAAVMGMNERAGWTTSLNTTAIATDNKAEKITYVAPSFYGLTAGASYVPNVVREDTRATPVRGASAYGAGALYAETFGPVGVKLSAGVVSTDLNTATGGSEGVFLQTAYGANLSYAGFTLGGSYQRATDDMKRADFTNNNFSTVITGGNNFSTSKNGNTLDYGGQAYDVGLQYANGPYAVSVAYFKSEVAGSIGDQGKDKMEFYQASGKYNLGAGVDLLASAGHAKYVAENHVVSTDGLKNEGWVVGTGLSLAF